VVQMIKQPGIQAAPRRAPPGGFELGQPPPVLLVRRSQPLLQLAALAAGVLSQRPGGWGGGWGGRLGAAQVRGLCAWHRGSGGWPLQAAAGVSLPELE
jgi:hypothetical protein